MIFLLIYTLTIFDFLYSCILSLKINNDDFFKKFYNTTNFKNN